MSPKEFNFMCDCIEQVAIKAYRTREEEKNDDKPFNTKQFKLTKANRLTLRSHMLKHTK